MSYSLDIDPTAQAAIAVLPTHVIPLLAEVFAVLELVPWSGGSVNPEENPDGAVRNMRFAGAGMVTYLVLEADRRVDVVLITWAG